MPSHNRQLSGVYGQYGGVSRGSTPPSQYGTSGVGARGSTPPSQYGTSAGGRQGSKSPSQYMARSKYYLLIKSKAFNLSHFCPKRRFILSREKQDWL